MERLNREGEVVVMVVYTMNNSEKKDHQKKRHMQYNHVEILT